MNIEKIVKLAADDVCLLFPNVSVPKIKIKKRKNDRYLAVNPSTAGYYDSSEKKITLCRDILCELSKKEVKKVVYHELGHYIHHTLLSYKAQYLPRKHGGDTSYYCNSNQKESFATCFSDYVYKVTKGKELKSKRLLKMDRIVRELKQG